MGIVYDFILLKQFESTTTKIIFEFRIGPRINYVLLNFTMRLSTISIFISTNQKPKEDAMVTENAIDDRFKKKSKKKGSME